MQRVLQERQEVIFPYRLKGRVSFFFLQIGRSCERQNKPDCNHGNQHDSRLGPEVPLVDERSRRCDHACQRSDHHHHDARPQYDLCRRNQKSERTEGGSRHDSQFEHRGGQPTGVQIYPPASRSIIPATTSRSTEKYLLIDDAFNLAEILVPMYEPTSAPMAIAAA